ncbi:MAG: FHA domain-containing protein [Deltaproteobacteria bacterium]|nr:FHA domain-containing protein [Deltaproteobacteria bacterium]
MATIHKLIIEDDEGKTTVVPLSRGEISIGRMEGNTIRLMERNVSRRHARLVRDNGSIYIEDLNSFNGVKINGERIDRKLEIKEGDLVEIGDYHLALQALEVEEEAPAGRADTVLSGPPEGAGANGNDQSRWRTQPGTLPDVRLPEQVAVEAREALRNGGASAGLNGPETVRDLGRTAEMRPKAPSAPPNAAHAPLTSSPVPAGGMVGEPLVGPPPKELRAPSAPPLPPFPASSINSPGAIAPTTIADTSLPIVRAREEQRTEQIQVGPTRLSDVARLVCVSTEYAGREFALTRPEVIIGRVEDNDVVIEHRSVSRNHAKILFDGRVHKIIDLESANGILVNGEEYAITDLRKGDLIELGHVRFRFIPAGEAFVPTEEEAQAMIAAGLTPPSPQHPFEPPTLPHKAGGDLHRAALGKEHDRTEEMSPGAMELAGTADPSTAATVTDTPLDVLGVAGLVQPKLESPTERPAPSHAPRRDPLPHEQTVKNPVRVGGAAESRRLRDPAAEDDDLRGGNKSSRAMVFFGIALVTLLLASLVAVFVAFSSGSSSSNADQELRTLFDRGDYEGVESYFYNNVKNFVDTEKAAVLVNEARERRRAMTAPKKPTEAAEPPEEPTPEEPSAIAAPEGEEAAPPEDTPEPPPLVAPKDEEAARRRAAAAAAAAQKKNLERARGLEKEGLRAFYNGDNAKAEDLYRECLRRADYAPCHRQLAVLYARTERSRLSCKHYEQYVKLAPGASDADNVRSIIAQNCGK